MEMDPHYPGVRNLMGSALLAAGRLDEAVECFNKLLQQKKDTAEVHYNWAAALSMQNKYDEAIKHLSRVLVLDPNHPDVHKRMGALLLAAGRTEEAITHLNEALRTNKGQGDVYGNLGMAYMQVGKNDLAVKNLTKAVELEPNNIDALNNLGWLLAAAGDVSAQDANRAVKYAQHACELTGYKKPDFLDTLAVAYAAAGRFEDAINTAKQAISVAKAAGKEELVGDIQKRIKLYEAGRRYQQK